VMTSGYLDKGKFNVTIETMHSEDATLDNALSLTPEELKERKVEWIDIVDSYKDKVSQ